MADDNFTTNQKMLGNCVHRIENILLARIRRMAIIIDDRNDKKFSPPRSSPRPRFILFTYFSNTNKAKTTLVYPNYWPTKIEYFDSASLRLYGLWALNNLSQRYAILITTILTLYPRTV
jgi:hypothetical protein